MVLKSRSWIENSTQSTQDTRIMGYKPLVPPQIIEMDIPISESSINTVLKARKELVDIMNRQDDRAVVIVGPCSIHDPHAAIAYAKKLSKVKEELKKDLLIIMRTYFEKPRTTVGWKGLINDPYLNGTYKINEGLQVARNLLKSINELGMPVASELLDTISPQYLDDFLSWGAIGARTTESQLHRELVSGVSFPIGFKNGTDGNVKVAVDAIQASSFPHHFMGVTGQGLASIAVTKGNPDCHIILRGGNKGPNYDTDSIKDATHQLVKSGTRPNIMIDCSHGNSQKQHKNQIKVCEDIAAQIAQGNEDIFGVMIESNLKEGRQDIPEQGPDHLQFGVSITDACVSFDDTVPMLENLAKAVAFRRKQRRY